MKQVFFMCLCFLLAGCVAGKTAHDAQPIKEKSSDLVDKYDENTVLSPSMTERNRDTGAINATPQEPIVTGAIRSGGARGITLGDYQLLLEPQISRGGGRVQPMSASSPYGAARSSMARQRRYLDESGVLNSQPEKEFTDSRRMYENSFKSIREQMASPRYFEDKLQMSRMENSRR